MRVYLSKPMSPHAQADARDKWLPTPNVKDEQRHEIDQKTAATGVSTVGHAAPHSLVFDRAALLERMMNDAELVQSVIEDFLRDTPRQIATLREYLDAGNVSGVERQAHTIKGTSATVSGETLRAVAFAMEQAAKAGNLDGVRALLPELDAQYDRVRQAMSGAQQ